MEYVDGKTLDELIPSKGLRSSLALKYAIQIADALAKAHDAGIVHRDLKPSNLMVTDGGSRQGARLRPGEAHGSVRIVGATPLRSARTR